MPTREITGESPQAIEEFIQWYQRHIAGGGGGGGISSAPTDYGVAYPGGLGEYMQSAINAGRIIQNADGTLSAGENTNQDDLILIDRINSGFSETTTDPTQESVIDQITDAFEQGTDALGNLLSGLIPEDMTIEGFLDWIKENVPETTPTDIFEQVLGQGVGIIFDGSGVIFDPTQGRIFVPGLPGVPLPPSSTILGTLEDLIEDPIGTVGTWGEDVWSQVLEGVQDPGAVIEGIFGEQEVPQSVISVILGSETLQDILGDWVETVVDIVDPNESTVDGDTTVGGVDTDDDNGDSVTDEGNTFEGALPGVEEDTKVRGTGETDTRTISSPVAPSDEDEEDVPSSETAPPEPPSGTTESGGRKSLFDDSAFKPFDYALAYQLPQLQQQIRPQQKDYNQQLEGLIGRSLFGKMLG